MVASVKTNDDHASQMVDQLLLPSFSSTFGDTKLVFGDCREEVHYYRVLLSLASPAWSKLLQVAGKAVDTILMPDVTRQEFFGILDQGRDRGEVKVEDFVEDLNPKIKLTNAETDQEAENTDKNIDLSIIVYTNFPRRSKKKNIHFQNFNKKHIIKHNSRQDNVIQYSCSKCNKVYTTKKVLGKHLKRHDCISCNKCTAKLPTIDKLENHIRLRHVVKSKEDKLKIERLKVRLEIAELEEKQGRLEETRDIFTSLMEDFKGNARIHKLFAEFEERAGNKEESIKLLSGLSAKTVKCNDCHKYFNGKCFERHRIALHALSIKCKSCDVEFNGKIQFRSHKANCFWKCNTINCSFKARRHYELKCHKATVHFNE